MISNKLFITSKGPLTSYKEFVIENRLQQGTVKFPIIFNIFNSDTINLFAQNSLNHKRTIVFVDNHIIYITDRKIENIKIELQSLFEKIQNHYHTWKL